MCRLLPAMACGSPGISPSMCHHVSQHVQPLVLLVFVQGGEPAGVGKGCSRICFCSRP